MRSRPGALKSSLQSSILEDLHVGRDQSLIIVRVVKNISQALRLLSEEVIPFNSIFSFFYVSYVDKGYMFYLRS